MGNNRESGDLPSVRETLGSSSIRNPKDETFRSLIVTNSNASSDIETLSGETITLSAGAAGTTGVTQVDKAPIMNSTGTDIGNLGDTSFAFVTGTVLDNEVDYDYDDFQDDQLSDMSNGDYAIDYVHGRIRYKKKTTATTDTANYKIRYLLASLKASFTLDGDVNIDVAAFKDTAGDRADAFVYAADEDLSAVSDVYQGIGGLDVTADRFRALHIATDDSNMPATPLFLPVGGEYRATPVTYTDGDATIFQTDENGYLYVSQGHSEFAEDSGHTSGDSGLFILGIRTDTLGTAANIGGTDADYMGLQMNSKGALYVDISSVLGSDMSVSNPMFTQLTDGTTGVSVIAATNALKGDLSSVAGTATNVNGGNRDAGTQTVTLADDDPAVAALEIIDDWDNTQDSPIGVDGSAVMFEYKDFDGSSLPNNVDTEGDAVRPAASAYGVQYTMLVNEDGSKTPILAEDSQHTSGDLGVMALFVRNDTLSSLAGTDGDYIPGQTDNLGRLRVNAGSSGVSGGGFSLYMLDSSNSLGHGTIVYASSTTLTVAGIPFTLNPQLISKIERYNSSGAWQETISPQETTITFSSPTITISAMSASSDDTFVAYILGPERTVDTDLDSQKTINQNPAWSRYTDKEDLIASAQTLTTGFADLGSEIDMRGFNQLALWLTVDINDASNVEIRLLHKHTSAGSEEFREIYLGSPASNITTINLNDYQVGSDADQLFKFNIPVSATTPFVQIQARMATDGGVDADIDAAAITKAWSA